MLDTIQNILLFSVLVGGMKNPDLGRYRSNRTSKVQVWFSGSRRDKAQGQEYRTNTKGVQQLFQCGRLRPESLNSIFFG